MKKFFLLLVVIVSCLSARAASITLAHDPITDTNVVKTLFYIRTNGLANTNFSVVLTNFNINNEVTISNVPSGKDLSFYATTVDGNHIESDPSNIASYFTPVGIPPGNIPVISITSYSKPLNLWQGVSVYWAAPSTNYNVTNYVVVFEGNGQTNRYPSLTNQFSLNSLVVADYNVYILSYNKEGVSPVTASNIRTLNARNPRKIVDLIAR